MSKKPAATRKPAAKKKAPILADHDDNSMDGEYTYTNPSVARSTSVAITKSNSNVTPVTSTNTYTVQPKDSGFSYSYVKDEKNLVEVDIHLWGNITQKTYRVEVSRCGMYLMWQRATPPTYFHDVLGNDTALRLNASDAVALQTTVWGLRTRFGSDGLKHHFGDEWQYFKLPQECHRKIHNSIICRDDGDIVRGNQQYNCIVRIFLLAKDQYKAEKENMVQEVYFGGGGGAGGGGGHGGSGGGSRKYKPDDDNEDDDNSFMQKPRASATGGGAAGTKRPASHEPRPTTTTTRDTKCQVKSEYVAGDGIKKENSNVGPIEIFDSDDASDY